MDITMPPKKKIKQPTGRAPKYSPEYYMMMAKHVVTDGMSYREAAKTYNVSHGSVHHWVKLYRDGKLGNRIKKNNERKKATDQIENYRLERYIKELKQEIGELYLENTMLKKALNYSQRIKSVDSSVITSENLDQFKEVAES